MGSLTRWAPHDRRAWHRMGWLAAGWLALVLLTSDYPLGVQLALTAMGLVAALWLEVFRVAEARARADRSPPSEDLEPASRVYRPATEYTVDRRRMPRWGFGEAGRRIRPVASG